MCSEKKYMSSCVLFDMTREEMHEELVGGKGLHVLMGQILKDFACASRECRLDFKDMRGH